MGKGRSYGEVEGGSVQGQNGIGKVAEGKGSGTNETREGWRRVGSQKISE